MVGDGDRPARSEVQKSLSLETEQTPASPVKKEMGGNGGPERMFNHQLGSGNPPCSSRVPLLLQSHDQRQSCDHFG